MNVPAEASVSPDASKPGVWVGYRHLLHEPGGRLVLLTPAG
jgi:hypothetical protein